MTVNANQIRKGMIILHNNEPALVITHELKKFGRGGANNKLKVKGLITGSSVPVTFGGNDSVETVEVTTSSAQYLYTDESVAVFMDMETYEQFNVELDNIPGGTDYLKEENKYIAKYYEGKVISIEPPKKIQLEVIEAPDAVKGDSTSNPQKEVILETGAKIMAPLFIKKGDIVEINTEYNEYTGKA